MTVDREEVERIGRLAKLRLTDDEAARLTDEMNRILEHAERLRGLEETSETRGAPDAPDADGAGSGAPTRPSAAEVPDALRIELRDFAPDHREGFFVVPPPPGVMADGRNA